MAAGTTTGDAFGYARSVAPMAWVLVALAIGELCIVHLLVALLWSGAAALILSFLTVATILWLVLFIRSMGSNPVLVEPDRLVMRLGFLHRIEIPARAVATVRTGFTGEEVKARGVLNLALLAYPNLLVELSEPVRFGRRRQPIRAVAHRLDDPAGFAAAIGPLLSSLEPGPTG